MTYEEVLHTITTRMHKRSDGLMQVEIDKEEMRMVVEAIEKQIPMKPIITYIDKKRTEADWTCPRCGEDKCSFIPCYYCHNCGQLIDWEGVEE